jgi:hypothetical protein
MLTILIYLTLGLLAASLVIMLVFGLRNLGRSSENKLVLASFLLPVLIVGVLLAVYGGDWVPALIMTALVLMVLAFLLLLVTAAQRFVR